MFVEEAYGMSYFMDNNRENDTTRAKGYPLGLERMMNSANEGAASAQEFENMLLVTEE